VLRISHLSNEAIKIRYSSTTQINQGGKKLQSCFGDSYLLDKSTATTVYHQNVRRRPGGVISACGVTFSGIHGRIAKVRVRVKDVLSDRSTIRGDTKKSLAVIITLFLKKAVGNL
jgi:hypothetical protein